MTGEKPQDAQLYHYLRSNYGPADTDRVLLSLAEDQLAAIEAERLARDGCTLTGSLGLGAGLRSNDAGESTVS